MTDMDVTTIPKIRRVFYDTYANLPVTNVQTGDLGYATDRRCLYHWSGAAWETITVYSLADLYAAIPAAADLPNGSIFYATDANTLYMKQGAAWLPVSGFDFPRKLKLNVTRWVKPGYAWVSNLAADLVLGRMYYCPIFVDELTTYIRIGIYVDTAAAAGKKVRLGIYEWDDGVPGDLILDAGTVDVDTTGAKEIVIAQALLRGAYFLAAVTDGVPKVFVIQESNGWSCNIGYFAAGVNNQVNQGVLYKAGEDGQVAAGLTDPAAAPTASLEMAWHMVNLREN